MSDRVRVVGTRPYVLWLLVIVAVTSTGLLIGGGLLARRSITTTQAITNATRTAEQALGACLTGLTTERWDEARQACATAVAVAPADATVVSAYDDANDGYRLSLYHRGKALLASGRPGEAFPLLDALFQMAPLYQDVSDLRAQAIVMQTPTVTPAPTARVTAVPAIPSGLEEMTEEFSYTHCVDDNCDVYVWNPIAKHPISITRHPLNDRGAVWSPDGGQLLFVSNRKIFRQFYIYNFEMAQSLQLESVGLSPAYPHWSPDGNRIVYQRSSTQDTWQLYLMDVKGNEIQELINSGTSKTPRWSPTGDRIAFSAAQEDSNNNGKIDDSDDRHIFVIDANGKNMRQLTTETGVYDQMPFWMPDGTHIAFIRSTAGKDWNDKGPGDIYFVNANGGNLRALTSTNNDEIAAVPSPRSDKFFIVRIESSREKIYLATWDGLRLGALAFLLEGKDPEWKPIR